MYQITNYTRSKAANLGVQVKHSSDPKKKIDVYKNGKKIASCGAVGYGDYPTYMKTHGKEYANKRRALYKMRHEKDRHVVGSVGYYSDKLLW